MNSPEPSRRTRRGHGRPTLEDVARIAQVTHVTVSRYLRQPALVAQDTGRRIREAIQQVGYVPNRQAGQLASARSLIVAALIPNVGHSIFAETIQGLSEALRTSDFELLLASTGYSIEREETQLRTLLGWAPAAVVVTGRQHTPGTVELLRQTRDAGVPVIEIWDHHAMPGSDFAQIGFDHEAVGRAMALHLIERGHRRLSYVDSGVAEDFRAHERGQAFIAQAQSSGAQVRLVRAALGDPYQAGREVLAQWQASAKRQRATALAFANDQIACGALLAADGLAVAVPRELALLGFGDFPLGEQLRPGLSSVRPPREEIGRAAAQAILSALREQRPPQGAALPWQLVERGSTAAR